ncbi:hypothetical protein D0T60_17895 [Bacteroides sp. 224]|nr:hypothetical protein [Bacteroides sp. 224]
MVLQCKHKKDKNKAFVEILVKLNRNISVQVNAHTTILGFIPSMIGVYKEAFWFSLAVGVMRGLIFLFFLPSFSFCRCLWRWEEMIKKKLCLYLQQKNK